MSITGPVCIIAHDLAARNQRLCIVALCEAIRRLEKRRGTEYEVALLRARKAELKEELMDYIEFGGIAWQICITA